MSPRLQDLEEALLTDVDTESEVDLKVYSARLLPDLIVALLKGCDALSQIVAHISPSNYQMFLRRLFRQKCQVCSNALKVEVYTICKKGKMHV